MELKLTGAEAEALRVALRSYVSDLRLEVADTERKGLRDQLKEQERLLRALLDRLDVQAVLAGRWPDEPPPDVDSEP